jgi:hypothetical protein
VKLITNSFLRSSIDLFHLLSSSYDLINNKDFEDFVEVVLTENTDIASIKYGVSKYLSKGEIASPTVLREVGVTSQYAGSWE